MKAPNPEDGKGAFALGVEASKQNYGTRENAGKFTKQFQKHPLKCSLYIGGHNIMTEQEYTELYTKHRKSILALVKAILGRDYARDAEDCVQEIFMRAWAKRDKIQKPIEWIKESARNEAYKIKELGQRYDEWGMPIALEPITRAAL